MLRVAHGVALPFATSVAASPEPPLQVQAPAGRPLSRRGRARLCFQRLAHRARGHPTEVMPGGGNAP